MSKADWDIRKARLADCPEIVKLWVELMEFHGRFEPYFTVTPKGPALYENHLRHIMIMDSETIFVARDNGRIVGFLMAAVRSCPPVLETVVYGEIMDVAVTADYRRRGVGAALVANAKGWFAKNKIKRIELNVSVKNKISMPFWEKMGFIPFLERRFLELD